MGSLDAIIIILVCAFSIASMYGSSLKIKNEVKNLQKELAQSQLREQQQFDAGIAAQNALKAKEEAYNTLLGQKKSSEVKVGFLAEALAPLHEHFPVPPETCRFLGAPFDFVSFDLENERIVFIECKSNGSVLSPKQKKLKQLILDGKVEFAEVRIGKDGVTSKVSSKM
jgi:predicted Holliday junction resolvase-like endonuclease